GWGVTALGTPSHGTSAADPWTTMPTGGTTNGAGTGGGSNGGANIALAILPTSFTMSATPTFTTLPGTAADGYRVNTLPTKTFTGMFTAGSTNITNVGVPAGARPFVTGQQVDTGFTFNGLFTAAQLNGMTTIPVSDTSGLAVGQTVSTFVFNNSAQPQLDLTF